jgi:hypothetical protein
MTILSKDEVGAVIEHTMGNEAQVTLEESEQSVTAKTATPW